MKAVLFVNGKSRRGREWYELADAYLKDQGLELNESRLFRNPKAMDSAIKAAIDSGNELICIGGGDGTISGAANRLAMSDATLGLLPFGTGNSLARDLEIPTDIEKACDIILAGNESKIDLGKVGSNYFVNVATVGISTLIAESLDGDSKKRFGRLVYLAAIWKAAIQCRRFNAKIELPAETLQFESVQVVVGNGRFHAGPFPITPQADIESGFLSGYSVNSSQKSVLLRYLLRLWHGRHVDMPEVVPFNAKSVKLTTKPFKRITIDGEISDRTPADFQSIPSALRVRTPDTTSAEAST